MATINVQYADKTKTAVTAFLGSVQDPKVYPFQDLIDTTDARWRVFFESLPETARQGLPVPTA